MGTIVGLMSQLGFDAPPALTLERQGQPGLTPVRSRNGSPRFDSVPMTGRAVGKQQVGAFQALCLKLGPELLRFACWLCHDHALAEDLAQQSIVRACKTQSSLLDEKAAKPCFLTIVPCELARTFERNRLTTVNVDDLVTQEAPSLASVNQDDFEEMRATIFDFPLEYRVPMVMQVLLDFSTDEIAAAPEYSLPAILTRLFRARQQLRTLCGEDINGDPRP